MSLDIFELKVPPLIQVILTTVLMWMLSIASIKSLIVIPGRFWIVGCLWIIGGLISLLGVIAFRQVKTTVDPRAPNRATHLVIVGIYQWSRNPMYLGFVIFLIGWAIFLSNTATVILIPVFILYMNYFQIKPEERFMLEKFADEYEAYMTKVRRWI